MAEQTQMFSHWYRHIEGLRQSATEFYGAVQRAVELREMKDVKFARVEFKEGGMFSAKREYLRVQRGDLYFDICGAPFGNGFFVSSRLFTQGSFMDGLIGQGLVKAILKPDTFYKVDTALMYQQLVHNGLMEVVDGLISAQSLPRIPDADRSPVMPHFYH